MFFLKIQITFVNFNRVLDGFHHTIDAVMFDCHNLAWIDLSHNYLVNLNYVKNPSIL